MLGGYVGKLLRVDLTKGTVTEEGLPSEDVLRKYVGCAGLGVKMLYDEVAPTVKPTDVKNKLYFLTGPLTGTPAPGGNNTTIVTIHFETFYTSGTAHTHGFWGPLLKFAGYDGIIIEGAAKSPVYLWVNDGKAEIRDAKKFWGKDTVETEDLIREDIGESRASVACIGPAGENYACGAGIFNDRHHMGGKGAPGAVMGLKKLKAIAVYGTGGVPLKEPQKLLELIPEYVKGSLQSQTVGLLMRGGITRGYTYLGEHSLVPTRNLTDPEWGLVYGENIVREAKKWNIISAPCFNCPVGCSYRTEVTTGRYKGLIATTGGGGEAVEGSSAILGIDEPSTVYYLTDLNDSLGFDSAGPGQAMGLAFELYERGLLTKKDTGGLELTWGNAEAAEKLLRMIAHREGLGNILAEGAKKAAEHFGGDAPKYAIHIKGGATNIHDWRGGWASQFAQIMAGAGPCHYGLGEDSFGYEPDLGYTEVTPGHDYKIKPLEVRRSQLGKLFDDAVGVCWFNYLRVPGHFRFTAQALAYVTGWDDFTVEERTTISERIINLERIFSIRRGFTKANDFDVSPRLLEAPPSGIAKGKALGPHLEWMINEYYRLMGWDHETGKPTKETMTRLGLEEYIKDIWR